MREFTPGVHKLVKHLEHLQKMKAGEVVAPIHVSIWPTIRCNLKCSYCCCKNTERNSPDLDFEIYKRAVDVLSKYGTKAIEISGGGEPLLWKDFSRAVDYTVDKGIKVSLITNGVYLDRVPKETLRKTSWVRISMQSADHVRAINRAHLKGIKLSGSFIVSDNTDRVQEMIEVAEFCNDNRITLRVAVERPCDDDFEKSIKYIVSQINSPFVFFSDKEHGTPDGCYMAWIRAAIDWEGDFLPCPSMHLSEEYRGYIPEKFRLCHVDGLEEWLNANRVHDMGFRCSTCNCGKENNDFFHKVITHVPDEEFV